LETLFVYKQVGAVVTIDYSCTTVIKVTIIGQLIASELFMLYHCITTSIEPKARKLIAQVSTNSDGRIELHLK